MFKKRPQFPTLQQSFPVSRHNFLLVDKTRLDLNPHSIHLITHQATTYKVRVVWLQSVWQLQDIASPFSQPKQPTKRRIAMGLLAEIGDIRSLVQILIWCIPVPGHELSNILGTKFLNDSFRVLPCYLLPLARSSPLLPSIALASGPLYHSTRPCKWSK